MACIDNPVLKYATFPAVSAVSANAPESAFLLLILTLLKSKYLIKEHFCNGSALKLINNFLFSSNFFLSVIKTIKIICGVDFIKFGFERHKA